MNKIKSITTTEKLFFLQDLSFGSERQVYSGHSGTGRNFKMYQSDYGKYAMRPRTLEECWKLAGAIERDALGKNGKGECKFEWKVIPITDVNLYNFWDVENQKEFNNLKKVQSSIV
jgi:hypothetical protein